MTESDTGRRVVASHGIARRAFRLAGMFAAVAAVWALVVLVRGGSWWGPLHSFLAGTVLAAIAGASQMFTITWSASPAPPSTLATAQRLTLAAGTIAALVGVGARLPVAAWLGGGLLVVSLTLLAWSIRRTIARSLLRRFDFSSRFYLTAFACGAVGVTLGAILGGGEAGAAFFRLRLVHSHLNLVGLVGFTIIGTLPTFLPTMAHHRAVSGWEAKVGWWLVVASAAAMASGLWLGQRAVGAGTVLAGIAALAVAAGIVVRLWEKGRRKLSFVQVTVGVGWLAGWAFVDGVALVIGGTPEPFGRGTLVAVTAGIGQVLLGSLAYLLPVVAGPPLDANLRRMTRRPAIPLVAANLAGAAGVAGFHEASAALVAIWVADFALRVVGLRRNRL